MNSFLQIRLSMGLGPIVGNPLTVNAVASGGVPALTFRYNGGGAGFQASLVLELTSNPNIHVTIYESSWDGEGPPHAYGEAPRGPNGLHLTYDRRHVFYRVDDAGNDTYTPWCLNDDESSRENLVIKTVLRQLAPHL